MDYARTVAAMDVWVPGIGEIIGGSQREERLEVLDQSMAERDIDEEAALRHGAARRLRPRLRADHRLRHRPRQHPRRHPLPTKTGKRGILTDF
jgi:tRNA synthetases class II (D, K and N)